MSNESFLYCQLWPLSWPVAVHLTGEHGSTSFAAPFLVLADCDEIPAESSLSSAGKTDTANAASPCISNLAAPKPPQWPCPSLLEFLWMSFHPYSALITPSHVVSSVNLHTVLLFLLLMKTLNSIWTNTDSVEMWFLESYSPAGLPVTCGPSNP